MNPIEEQIEEGRSRGLALLHESWWRARVLVGTRPEEDEVEQASDAEHERLEALVGNWKTQGWTKATTEAPAAEIDAVDTYEWAPGGFALLHGVDAKVGDEKVEGAEIIGYDPERGAYVTQYFGSDGPAAYEANLAEENGSLTWRMRGETTRFTGTFSDDGSVITGHWELLPHHGNWQPWMDITLTKQAS
jgi:Protein of unknown function (DUF1579)